MERVTKLGTGGRETHLCTGVRERKKGNEALKFSSVRWRQSFFGIFLKTEVKVGKGKDGIDGDGKDMAWGNEHTMKLYPLKSI